MTFSKLSLLTHIQHCDFGIDFHAGSDDRTNLPQIRGNLDDGETIEGFVGALDKLNEHLIEADLIVSTGPVGRRQRDTIMDTDEERDHEYFFLMSFRDRAQCDLAVAHMYRKQEPTETLHLAAYRQIEDPVFICWEDL